MNNNLSSDREILYNLNENNQDELVYYAAKSQASLKDFSNEISTLLINSSSVERLLSEITEKLDKGSTVKQNKGILSILGLKTNREYQDYSLKELLSIIENLSVQLQIHEAELIKNNTILKNMGISVRSSYEELTELINMGEEWLNEYKRKLDTVGSEKTNSFDMSQKSKFINRVENKLKDLEISRTVALQAETQLNFMLDNNCSIVDKILIAVEHTIPLWKNQITILMSSEGMIHNNKTIDIISEIIGNRIEENSVILKNDVQREKDFSNRDSELNGSSLSLYEIIKELECFNKTNETLKLKISDIVNKSQ